MFILVDGTSNYPCQCEAGFTTGKFIEILLIDSDHIPGLVYQGIIAETFAFIKKQL